MSERLKNIATIPFEKLSLALGALKYLGCEKAKTNTRTGEVTTIVKVFSEKMLGTYEVTVAGDPSKELEGYEGKMIDFANAEFGHGAEIMDGWQGAKRAGLYDVCKADSVILVKPEVKPNGK